MAITYDPTLVDAISQVRFHIGDTVEGNGPRPSVPDAAHSNFSDAEVQATVNAAVGDVPTAVAKLFGVLATEWTKYATVITVGPYKEDMTKLAERYTKAAADWAVTAGLTSKTFSSGVRRASSVSNSEFSS